MIQTLLYIYVYFMLKRTDLSGLHNLFVITAKFLFTRQLSLVCCVQLQTSPACLLFSVPVSVPVCKPDSVVCVFCVRLFEFWRVPTLVFALWLNGSIVSLSVHMSAQDTEGPFTHKIRSCI